MAKLTIFLLISQIITLPILSGSAEGFEDFVSSYIQQYGDSAGSNVPGLVSHLMGTLMQGDNAKEMASNLMSAFLQGDGSKNFGSMLGQGGGDAGNILAGLGSLLGGQNGQIDPSLVGNMISMFTQTVAAQQPKVERQKRQAESAPKRNNDINLDGILNLASGFLGKNSDSILPMVMNAISAFSASEAEKKAQEHKDHASFLPPVLETVHLYWDLFMNSELGNVVWEKSGLKKAFKSFTGPDGKISFSLVFKNFENQQFRRHWIKAAASYLTDSVVHMSKPEVYQRYLVSAQYIINTYLDSQGLPKSAHFNAKKPEKSISILVNHALKRYLDMDTDVSEYVKPAVDYVKQTIQMAQTKSQTLKNREDYNAITDRVTDTLNLDVIEPVLRVYRAYKHSLEAPHCQEHLMCLVNKDIKTGGSGFKAGLTKISSLAASAALSFQNGKGFWDLYNAVQNDVNCEAVYPADCAAFHEYELKVTTEPYHSEL